MIALFTGPSSVLPLRSRVEDEMTEGIFMLSSIPVVFFRLLIKIKYNESPASIESIVPIPKVGVVDVS